MRRHILSWLFLILLCLINHNATNGYFVGQECSTLLHLKNSLIFNPTISKKLSLWNQSEDCCQWHGVTCNEGLVVALDLSEESISGGLTNSSVLFSLQYLQSLNLAFNNLRQGWCHAISSLHKLRVLSMSSCNLSGPIDSSLARLLSLTVLKLSHNNMTSIVPGFFVNFSNLVTLQLRSCGLNGSFPKDIFQIPTLKILDISDNKDLGGSLPNFQPHGSLLEMNLSYTNFKGRLPGAISNLKQLSTIDLSYCKFNGTLPSSITVLTQLIYLDLSSNNFTGPLPSFNMSKNLTYLSLFHNQLSGVLPSSHFEGLKNLASIDLGFNFFSGSLPSSLLKLPYLRELKLPFNQLGGFLGPISESIFNHTTLRVIQLNSNKLNGTIQLDMIRRLSNLTTLSLSHNNFSVDIYSIDDRDLSPFPNLRNLMLASCKMRGIPSFVRNLSTLLYLDLADNEIEGSIPQWIWQLEYLAHLNLSRNFLTNLDGPFPFIPTFINFLDFSNNKFNSVIPLNIGNNAPFIKLLSLSNNNFRGHIHESFCNASSLRLLDLSHNNFVGTIPKCFATLSSTLRVLNFGGNKLQGYIPNSLATSCTLKLLDLNDNLLDGPIPKSLANCQKLQVLNLRRNSLLDGFPCFLSSISTLRIMDLRLNKLHGSIRCPRSSGDWKMLHIVDLASNNFSGAIPGALLNRSSDAYVVDISRYQNSILITNKGQQVKLDKIQRAFTYLDMSSNHFEGPIPNELMQFKAMNALNLSNNALSGHIPSSIENLKNLESLDFSNNSFNGEIPTNLASLSFLAYLNLSYNHLVGQIPIGTQIQSFEADSFEGNKELCGPPLTHNCSNGVLSPETPHSHIKSSIDCNFLSAELGFIFGFGIFILPLIFWSSWRLWYSKHIEEMLHKIIPQLDFAYEHHGGKRYRTLRWSY
uniref:LRR receptor-like serine/threonine-protein kinase GSO1 n=1 Tax=Cajanus cajan TaxID=3821 RepID=A0A151QTC3_CAJCA|nr:LRR receptor-like serine/threonine-protein kinase GSO1 [Cajanus cajan]